MWSRIWVTSRACGEGGGGPAMWPRIWITTRRERDSSATIRNGMKQKKSLPRIYWSRGTSVWISTTRNSFLLWPCCCSHINSHNQVRGHRTSCSHSGAEEYPRENTHATQGGTRIYHSWRNPCLHQKHIKVMYIRFNVKNTHTHTRAGRAKKPYNNPSVGHIFWQWPTANWAYPHNQLHTVVISSPSTLRICRVGAEKSVCHSRLLVWSFFFMICLCCFLWNCSKYNVDGIGSIFLGIRNLGRGGGTYAFRFMGHCRSKVMDRILLYIFYRKYFEGVSREWVRRISGQYSSLQAALLVLYMGEFYIMRGLILCPLQCWVLVFSLF